VVRYLVEKGADFRVKDNWAVRFASAFGHVEVVKYLVENGVDFQVDDFRVDDN
jgi:polyhydroxyalkanoate synthesis regulator protein